MCGIEYIGQMIDSFHAERDLDILVNEELKFDQNADSVVSKVLQTLGIVKECSAVGHQS